MSVRQLIALVDPAAINVTEFCAQHGLSTSSFYRYRARLTAEGPAGLEARSRAPKRVANRTSDEVEDIVVSLRKELDDLGVDSGPATIWAHLPSVLPADAKVPSESTIWRMLTARGLITPQPRKGRRRRWKRFVAERANECWQGDSTHWALRDGTPVEIINIIDDHSRLAVASQAVPTTTKPVLWNVLGVAAQSWGWPQRFLRDNGPPYRALSDLLDSMHIQGASSRPYHPQTCGKVERFHQTVKQYLDRHGPFDTIEDLQGALDWFIDYYNHTRPHRALNRATPASVWHTAPKTGPSHHPLGTPTRVLHGIVRHGRVIIGDHRISVGVAHNDTPITAIITGQHCHLTGPAGQLIRQLTINPAHYNQPLHPRPGRPKPE